MIDITEKKVPHLFRNKYLRNAGSGSVNKSPQLPGTNTPGASIDIVKTDSATVPTDSNVLSSLRALLEIRSRIIASTDDETALSEDNTLSSLHTVAEIDAAIKSALKDIEALYLSKTKADTAAEAIIFLKGLFVGDNLAHIDANGDAEVKNLVARMKAKVATLEVTGAASVESLTASDKVTTLNLLVQELASIHDLDVSHVATMFRTIIKDYVSSETFIPGLTGEGFKISKALNGDWNLEIDNVVIRKVMTIFELVVSKLRSVNGGLVVSSANGRIKSVGETTGEPTYYVLGIEGDMQFVADDLVRCQVFTSGQVKFYWVPVASVTADSILVLKSEFTVGVFPVQGDDLIQMGNLTNKSRQGVLYLTASEDGKPRFSVLDGVNSTSTVGKSKVILGCLDGITDTDFPADFQPSGYGLYAMNVFLKGVFILRNGKSVEDEVNAAKDAAQDAKDKADAVTRLFQEFTVAGGLFESKITEVKTYADGKADTAKQEAINDAANKYPTRTEVTSSINQKADEINLSVTEKISNVQTQITANSAAIEVNRQGIALKASQTTVDGLGNRLSTAESTLKVQAGQISAQVSSINSLTGRMSSAEAKITDSEIRLTVVSQQATNTAIEYANLSAKLAGAKMLYRDPTFKEGNNGISVYNNNGNGTTTITRMGVMADNPTDSGYQILITSTGYSQTPGRGGFHFGNQVHIYGEYICKFIAWIPIGSNVCFATNSIGDGGYQKWLTPTAGQGKWTEYVSYVRGGSANTSSTNFYYIDSGAETLNWWLCYATVFECSSSEDTPTRDEIKSGIGITTGGITVFGKTISLIGAVTFDSLSGDAKNKINDAQNAANAANGAAGTAQNTANDAVNKANAAQGTANTGVANANAAQGTANDAWNRANNAQSSANGVDSALTALRNSLGGLAYDNAVNIAKLDSTIIEGGYFKTNLINARAIVTGSLIVEQIAAGSITADKIKVDDLEVTKLKGATGSFKKLTCVSNSNKEVGAIEFGNDGKMWFSGDMYHQGYNNTESRLHRFYASDLWCRGEFGHYRMTKLDYSSSSSSDVFFHIYDYGVDTTYHKYAKAGQPIDCIILNGSANYVAYVCDSSPNKMVAIVNASGANKRIKLNNSGATETVLAYSFKAVVTGQSYYFNGFYINNLLVMR